MNLYEKDDIISILRRSSLLLDIKIDEKSLSLLADCCRGTPRVANRILRRVRDFAQVKGDGSVDENIVRYSLEKLEIDSSGLELFDRRILETIIMKYAGGTGRG